MIKNSIDTAFCHVAEFANAGVTPRSVLRSVETAWKLLLILRTLNQDLRICLSSYSNLMSAAYMQSPWSLCKDIFSACLGRITIPSVYNFTGKQQYCDLLTFSAEGSLLACFHPVNTDVHHHCLIIIIIGCEDHLPIITKFWITKYFSHFFASFLMIKRYDYSQRPQVR